MTTSSRTSHIVDASGVHGRDASHGSQGHDGIGSGSDGDRGGHAGISTGGLPGGTCFVILSSLASRGDVPADTLLLDAKSHAHNSQEQPHQYATPLAQLDWVTVLARGGRGGHGGRGGPGGNGARGRKGSDATRYSSGGNGGRGGDGGDGGKGSHGQSGGDGGVCVIRMDERDTYLLMALAHAEQPNTLTLGGPAGQRGKHGQGGFGGSGGPGGDSYSWTEQESYTDSEGNTQYRSVSRRNSGGSRGPSGSSGWTPTAALHPGASGAPGNFTIQVASPDGTSTSYPARYDLEIIDFELAEDAKEDVDGIFEFGEVVHVVSLTVRNIGEMPTPAHQRIRAVIQPGTWVRPLEAEIFLAQSLPPDHDITLSGSLPFKIPLPQITGAGEPYIMREQVHPLLFQLGVEPRGVPAGQNAFQRHYSNATLTRELIAQFPVENRQGIVGLRSLAPGEITSMYFDVGNVSERDIGEGSERGRKVGVQVEFLEGDMDTACFELMDAHDNLIDLNLQTTGFPGYFETMPMIASHSSEHVSMSLGFRKGVPAYVGITLGVSLWIEEHDTPGKWRLVQRRKATFRAEPAYTYRPESRIVLVTHNNTSREAFLAWQQLLDDELGLPFDHWSLARYGHFDHSIDLEDGTNLRVQMEDKLALVLNNHFQPRGKEKESDLPTDYIKGQDVRHGATSNNTHFLMIGSPEFEARQLLEPTTDFRRQGDDFPDIKRFMVKEQGSVGTFEEETFKDDITMMWDEVTTHDWTFFSKPSADKRMAMMRKRSQELMNDLAAMHPNRRYLLVEHLEPELVQRGRSWLMFPRWELGKLEVRRTLNLDTSSTLVLHADDARLNDPEFILSERTRYAVLLAMPFEVKLERLNVLLRKSGRLEGHRKQSAMALVHAIMTDISEEQSALMLGKGGLDEEQLAQKLSNLGRLTREPLHTNLSFGDTKWDILFELCASLDALAQTTPWWTLWGRQRAINRYVLAQSNTWRSILFDAYALDPNQDVAMDSDSALVIYSQRTEQLLTRFATRRAMLKSEIGAKLSLAEVARAHFEHPEFMESSLKRDIDEWTDPNERIWTIEQLAQASEAEAKRHQKQEELRELNLKTRNSLLQKAEPEQQMEAAPEVVLDLSTIEEPVRQVVEASAQ